MCIAGFVWQAHPLYPLLLFFNRDEYHNRPTKPASWWEDDCEILGGRDERAGGTWLACTKQGRLAFLTNVSESFPSPEAKTRGNLPVRFLKSTKSPLEFAEEMVKEADQYNGFNLIFTDICSRTMVYVSNSPKGEPCFQEVSPGIHVLSNAKLDTPWHKAQRLGQSLKESLEKYSEGEEVHVILMVEELMNDTVKADESKLPHVRPFEWEYNSSSIFIQFNTPQAQRLGQSLKESLEKYSEGEEVPVILMVEELMNDTVKADESKLPHVRPFEWEYNSSSIFIQFNTPQGGYGTRSTAAIAVKESGEVSFYEKYLTQVGWKEHTLNYQIENV